ncbi:hypothetical protein KSP39_PZI015751 [Platanthera zijinensis]|uniref:Expansin-like EG45 domain-containing protein n=1 Tax=Platanthera zijinensis TaxID=2320716 RepID=A0AAP0BAJ3_9ASPA
MNYRQLLLLAAVFLPFSAADVGTASSYVPPYLPTNCFGNDTSAFPADASFAAAGAAIWDNGAACGRKYEVRCLSSDTPGACVSGDVIVMVTVVDQAARLGSQQSAAAATMSLSETAFRQIASLDAPAINIEYAVL